MVNPEKREPKKPYEAPKLTVYGTVLEITQSTGPRGNKDGGHVTGAMMSRN
jgi:hypothetical protein